MDESKRKLMAMHKVLHSRSDADIMSQEKKEVEDLPALLIALMHR